MITYVFKMAMAIMFLCKNTVEATYFFPSIFHCDMLHRKLFFCHNATSRKMRQKRPLQKLKLCNFYLPKSLTR